VTPLQGRRVVVTRAAGQAGRLVERLRAAGAEVVELPTVVAEPLADRAALDAALASLDGYDWLVLTSANGAAALGPPHTSPKTVRLTSRARADGSPLPLAGTRVRVGAAPSRREGDEGVLASAEPAPLCHPEPSEGSHPSPSGGYPPEGEGTRPRLAAVGPATASALTGLGWPAPWTPSRPNGRALAEELPVRPGERVLLLRSDLADPALPAALAGRGARVDEVVAYRTVPRPAPLADPPEADAYVLMSPSAVDGLVNALGGAARLAGKTIVAAGPTTAAHLARLGLPAVQADAPTPDAIVDALAAVPA
jgi:uroporphyrinogen-III synthase